MFVHVYCYRYVHVYCLSLYSDIIVHVYCYLYRCVVIVHVYCYRYVHVVSITVLTLLSRIVGCGTVPRSNPYQRRAETTHQFAGCSADAKAACLGSAFNSNFALFLNHTGSTTIVQLQCCQPGSFKQSNGTTIQQSF